MTELKDNRLKTELKLNLSIPVEVVVNYETRKTVPMTFKGYIGVRNQNGDEMRTVAVCEKNGKLYISRCEDVTFWRLSCYDNK